MHIKVSNENINPILAFRYCKRTLPLTQGSKLGCMTVFVFVQNFLVFSTFRTQYFSLAKRKKVTFRDNLKSKQSSKQAIKSIRFR